MAKSDKKRSNGLRSQLVGANAPKQTASEAVQKKQGGTTKKEAGQKLPADVRKAVERDVSSKRAQAAKAADAKLAKTTDRRARAAYQQEKRDALYPVAGGDRKLSTVDKQAVQHQKALWAQGEALKQRGRTTQGQSLQEWAHREAEMIRARRGYSGGKSGTDDILPLLDRGEELFLRPKAKEQLRAQKRYYDIGGEIGSPEMQQIAQETADAIRFSGASWDRDRIRDYKALRPAQEEVDAHGRSIHQYNLSRGEGEAAQALFPAIGNQMKGSWLSLLEAARTATRNMTANRYDHDYQLQKSLSEQATRKAANERDPEARALLEAAAERETARADALRHKDAVRPWSDGQLALQRAAQQTQTVMDAIPSKGGQYVTQAFMSGVQMLPAIGANFLLPGSGTFLVGAQAAGGKAGELGARGISAQEALARGALSGVIEGATEKIPLDNLLRMVRSAGGAPFLANVAKQAGIEATEESASYLLNYAADVAARDPAATFSLQDLAENAAVGAISGAGFGGLGHMAGMTVGRADTDPALLRAAEEAAQREQGTREDVADAAAQAAGPDVTETVDRTATGRADEALARPQGSARADARETAPVAAETPQRAVQEVVRPAAQMEQARPVAQKVHDIRRVRDAAASLGENGAKALSASYDGSVRADDYYAGFASYYEAGISGIDIDKVQSRYAAQLNQAQRFAAYSAGQNDAAASLALEREGVKSATVYGDEAGFVQSEHSASLPKETVRFYDSLARAAGVKIQMAEATGKGGANGWYSNGIIHIANDAENPGTVVAKHEITHRMQEMAPEAYRKYRDYAMSALAEQDGSTASIVEQYKSRYAEAGVNLSTEQAMDEIAADFTEALTVDPARFETLAKENRSVARKLLDAVRDFIRKVKSLFKGDKAAQNQAAASAYGVSTDTLEEAARLWEEALKATSEQAANKNAAQTDGGTKFSIKRTSQMTLAQQLKMFYDGKMASSDAFYFGETPDTLNIAGLDTLPLAFTVSDFRKSSKGKHNVPRRVWKNLHSSLETALFSFRQGNRIGIMTGDIDGDGKPLLVGIERNVSMDRTPVNAIRSVYGLDNPGPWLQNQIKAGKELVLLDKEKANAFLQTYGAYSASVGDGIRSTGESVPQNGAEVKAKFSLKEDSHGRKLTEAQREYFQDSKVVDGDGRLLTLYHQTDGAFTVFNPRHKGSGTGDDGTPFGIFMKTSARDIGLSGKNQMELYANMTNPLRVKGREELSAKIRELSPEYDALIQEHADLDKTYSQKHEDAKKAWTDFVSMWRKENPGASRTALYDVPEFNRLFNAEDTIVEEWTAKADELAVRAKEELTAALQKAGYDGVIIQNDKGSWGRSTDAYIALSPAQVKNVTNQNPTSNPDIRYSLKNVSPVKPTSDDWKPGATFDEVKAAHPTLFALDADEADTRNPTQITGTVKSYRKIYDALQAEDFDGTILDASSGLGYGTRAGREEYGFDVDDIEPFPDAKYQPNYTNYSTLNKTYDVIISNAVLNVMPQDLRDAMVVKIGEMLNPGGRAFINVRGTDVKNAGSKVAINDDLMEYFISNTGSYQKGFTSKELVSYLKDALGDGFTVEPTRKFGAVSAIVTRDGDRLSLKGRDILRENAALQEENRLLREQMKNYIDLQRRNRKLRESRDYWQGQVRRTQRVTTDRKAVAAAAKKLIRDYGSDIAVEDIQGDLQSLYDYIASGYDGKDELTHAEARRRAEAIARTLVENAVAVDSDLYDQYSDLREHLRTTKIVFGKEYQGDIPDYGDFRKRQFGRLKLSGEGGTNIDQVYQELSTRWPEFFDEEAQTQPADQLLRITEVLDAVYSITEYDPFSRYADQAVTGAANEILEAFFDLPQTRKTFADRQAARLEGAKARDRQQLQQVRAQSADRLAEQKAQSREALDRAVLGERMAGERTLAKQKRDAAERLDKVRAQNAARLAELREQNRQRVQSAIAKERETRERKLDALKDRYAARDAAGRERRTARALRGKIVRHVKVLSRKLLRPSDEQHVPESLRGAVAAMLESIDLESQYTIDENGRRVKGGDGTPTKRTEAFRALRLAYAQIAKDSAKDGEGYSLIIDPDLMDNLDQLEAMKDTPLMEMGLGQLETVWATVKAVEASIRTANKMLAASRFETISSFADGIRTDNLTKKDRGNYRGVLGKVDKLANLDMLTPQGYFHRLGKTGEELFRMMRAAQDRHITIMRQAQEKTAQIIGETDTNALERETHTFDLQAGTVKMSTAQIMSLYELMKREQAREHVLVGGIRPDTLTGRRSLKEERRSDPVHVTAEEIADILSVLTEEQTKAADGLQQYMSGDLAELGNEASMTVYGYRKFTARDYFPIKVDQNQTKRDITKEAQAATIAGRGFTKSVAPKANNAVMVESIFDTYASHVNDMATYAAWLPAMEDVRRIRDFTFRDEEGGRTGDVKTIIERVFGRNGNAYLNKLVDDINQGVRTNGTGALTDGLVGNYKAAAVAANLRVILQQPTSILRALDTLDAKYLLEGTVKRGDWEKVKKYAPIAVWKDWGYFDINTGRQMKDVLLSSDTVLERVRQAAMAGAGKADSFAWARLWNAVEAETKDKRPGLAPGTEEFYRAVAARFGELIDGTQVVDGLLQRSQIMRSPDALTKMSTSFMGEPTKTYNMFVNAVYDLRNADGKEARTRAKRGLARTTTALVVSFSVNAVMQSLVDALRDDDKERDYWEKLLSAYTGFSGDEETFLDYWNGFWDGNLGANFNPAGYLPYLKDMLSIAKGYDVSRMDMEPISKVWSAAVNMKKALSGEGKYSLAGASANLLAEAARLLGIPVANLKRDIQASITTAAIETDDYLMQYRIDKALLNMGYAGNTGNFMDILYNASLNDREAYEIIYADMVNEDLFKTATKTTEQRIAGGMEERMKKAQGVESVADLETRYLTPKQERRYDSARQSIAGTPVWGTADAEQRKALEDDLYDLVVSNSDGIRMQEKIAGGAAYGIGETEYLLYRLALHVVDQPNESGDLGSYTGEEVQAAIDMLPGLGAAARSYLWTAAGKSEKRDPYK